jgi:hypothetical protein
MSPSTAAKPFDPETMAAGVNCIIAEIQKRRHAIEAEGATTQRSVN